MKDALKYAQKQSDTFKNSLQYLIEQQNQQKLLDEQTTTQRYQNLLEQINQQVAPVTQGYEANAQQAYVNKMLGQKQIESNINRMGLNTQGFGVTQQALNENSYGNNLSTLQTSRDEALRNIENQKTNATGDYNVGMSELDSNYARRLNDLKLTIEQQVANKYDTAYNNYMSNKQYQDQLKQKKIDNSLAWASINASKQNNTFGGGTAPIINQTSGVQPQTYNDSMVVSANYSPGLSGSAAYSWFDKNIASQVAKNNGITVGNLKKIIDNAYNKKIINEDDAAAIMKSFNLIS